LAITNEEADKVRISLLGEKKEIEMRSKSVAGSDPMTATAALWLLEVLPV
jgi:hypothetical protein